MKLTTFCFSFLMFAIQAFGLGDEMHFRHYDNRDGLSHNTVFCAIQDRSGFMWFGTNEGLDRFDGYTFKVYEYDSRDSLSLIQNRVNSMCEASDGPSGYARKTESAHITRRRTRSTRSASRLNI